MLLPIAVLFVVVSLATLMVAAVATSRDAARRGERPASLTYRAYGA